MSSTEAANPSRQTAAPRVSVIVPTFNRAETLADTLRALAAQDYPADRLEIVVVDNSSTDATEEVVRDLTARASVPIRYFRKDNHGPAASRNFGVEHASGDVLAFTDSDCTMAPGWVRAAVDAIEAGADLVYGPVQPVINPRRVPSFFYHQTDHSRPNAIYPTANVWYRREVMTALGGFQEAFGAFPWGTPHGGEDIDLAWRAKCSGYRDAWAPDLVVYHEGSDIGLRTWLIEPVRMQIMPSLVRRFPALRRDFVGGVFLSRETLAFYPFLLGGLAATLDRHWRWLMLGLPWVWLVRTMVDRDVWPPARWWRIPLKYALMAQRHALLSMTLVWASGRARTVVL